MYISFYGVRYLGGLVRSDWRSRVGVGARSGGGHGGEGVSAVGARVRRVDAEELDLRGGGFL